MERVIQKGLSSITRNSKHAEIKATWYLPTTVSAKYDMAIDRM